MQAGGRARKFPVNFATVDDETVGVIAKVLRGGIALALLALWVFARRGPAARDALLFGTAALGMLLLSEVSLTTHHLLLLIPAAALLGSAFCPELRPRWPAAQWVVWASVGLSWLVGVQLFRALGVILYVTLLLLAGCVYGVLRSQRSSDSG